MSGTDIAQHTNTHLLAERNGEGKRTTRGQDQKTGRKDRNRQTRIAGREEERADNKQLTTGNREKTDNRQQTTDNR